MTTIEARDAATNAVLGTSVNFAAHPTNTGSSNREFTGDWCWYLNQQMEAGRSGAPSSFFNGPQGDVSGDDICCISSSRLWATHRRRGRVKVWAGAEAAALSGRTLRSAALAWYWPTTTCVPSDLHVIFGI
jgi:hypothetical protein